MTKLKSILYTLVFILALISRTLECFFGALLEAGVFKPSFFVEAFRHQWTDVDMYTPVDLHVERIKSLWRGDN